MSNWQAVLSAFVQEFEQLPESMTEAFLVSEPSGNKWPRGLPSSPTLIEFYSICGGGVFCHYVLHDINELQDFGENNDEFAEPNRYVEIGDTEFGQTLVWDSQTDRIGYFDLDGADGFVWSEETGAPGIGSAPNRFFEILFSPSSQTKNDKVQQKWNQVLLELESHT